MLSPGWASSARRHFFLCCFSCTGTCTDPGAVPADHPRLKLVYESPEKTRIGHTSNAPKTQKKKFSGQHIQHPTPQGAVPPHTTLIFTAVLFGVAPACRAPQSAGEGPCDHPGRPGLADASGEKRSTMSATGCPFCCLHKIADTDNCYVRA